MVVTILGILIFLAAFLSLLGIAVGEHYLRYDNENYQYLGSLICRVSGIVLFVTCISVAMIDARYDSSKVSCILAIVACVSAGAFGLNEFIRGSNIANILLEEFADYEEEEEEEETLERAENVEVDTTENVEVQSEATNFIVGDSLDYEAFSAYVSREFDEILEEIDSLLEEEESK